jgi:hypothetical protein
MFPLHLPNPMIASVATFWCGTSVCSHSTAPPAMQTPQNCVADAVSSQHVKLIGITPCAVQVPGS